MKLISQFSAYTIATVLIGIFAVTFKTDSERLEIMRRVSEVTRPITNIFEAANLKRYY